MRIHSRDNSVSLKKIFTVQDTLGDLDSDEYNITMSLQYHDGSVSMVMGYRMNSHGSIPGKGKRVFPSPHHPDRLWSPSSLLSNEYQGLFLLG
jgi:hypothetical protein